MSTDSTLLNKKIELIQWLSTIEDVSLLNKIMNPKDNKYYAPDLALAIKLYTYLYIDNPKKNGHTHSNSANHWLSKNTGYDVTAQSGSRIRELTAPLSGWNSQRDKKFIKH